MAATLGGRGLIDVAALPLAPDAEKAIADGRLNREQAASAYADVKTTLVLGPPGTGKTKTLVERVGILLDWGVAADRIFCGTFTAPASNEIVTRVNERHSGRLVAAANKQLAFGTLNSLGRRFLKLVGPRAGYTKLDIPKSGEHIALAKKLGIDLGLGKRNRSKKAAAGGGASGELNGGGSGGGGTSDFGWHGPGFGGTAAPDFGAIGGNGNLLGQMLGGKVPAAVVLGRVHDMPFLELVARWGGKLIFPEDAIRIAEGDGGKYVPDEALAKRARDYKRYKDALYGEGLIDFSDQISLPVKILRERADLRTAFQSRFDGVLVDEYQDVNTALGALVDLLAGGAARLWCVGDPDQTLYGFNGSDPRFILDFHERWPEARVIALRQNYRSRPAIVAAANKLIICNKNRYETTLTATRPDVVLEQNLGTILSTPNLKWPAPRYFRRSAVEVANYTDDDLEARDIARKVAGLLGLGVNPGQIAILCRSAFRAYPTVQALRGAGVQIKVLRGQEKSEPEESQLVEGLLRAVHYPGSGAGYTDLDVIRRMIGDGERGQRLLVEAEQLKKDGYANPQQWVALVHAVDELVVEEGPPEKSNGGDSAAGRISQRWTSRVRAATQAAVDRGSYDAWCAAAPIVGKDTGDTSGGGVMMATLGTIHGVKGLEYEHVFILGLESDICPDGGDIANEEERRLVYVAFTRARDTLTVSWAARRGGDRFASKMSPYIDEAFWQVPNVPFIDFGVAEAAEGGGLDLDALESAKVWPSRRQGSARTGGAGSAAATPRIDAPGTGAMDGLRGWAGSATAPAATAAAMAPIAAQPADSGAGQLVDKDGVVEAPAPAGGEQETMPLWLGICGGSEGAVWRVWLVAEDNRILYQSFINPAGDYMACYEAMRSGVETAVLDDAQDLGMVVSELRRVMIDVAKTRGLSPILYVDEEKAAALGIGRWAEVQITASAG